MAANVIPPILYEEFVMARQKAMNGQPLSKDEKLAVVGVGSYWGSLIKSTYKKLVWQRRLPAHAFWNALIKVFIFGVGWRQELAEVLKGPDVKKMSKRLSAGPKWIEIGLIGCDWPELRKMCERYCSEAA